MDEAAIWKERYYSLLRWVKQHQPITEATPADWEDFWYNSESEGKEYK
tara:strand:- start:861 stop:1004 length:144 start_codon:yes stop_codon:yes gene_type:complete